MEPWYATIRLTVRRIYTGHYLFMTTHGIIIPPNAFCPVSIDTIPVFCQEKNRCLKQLVLTITTGTSQPCRTQQQTVVQPRFRRAEPHFPAHRRMDSRLLLWVVFAQQNC